MKNKKTEDENEKGVVEVVGENKEQKKRRIR